MVARATACALVFATAAGVEAGDRWLVGLNVAGAEFGKVPGQHGVDYVFPGSADFDYVARKKLNTVRLPFRWERLQRALFAPLDPAELKRLKEAVAEATRRGLFVILDLHNHARYDGKVVGTAELPVAALADFWSRLATEFKANDRVVFGVMNEPHDMPTRQWLDAANAAIAAIRHAGASNLLLVPGNDWTGAHSWATGKGDEPNADVMGAVIDPRQNFAYEIHQYLDADFSGTGRQCPSVHAGQDALGRVTRWVREHGAKAHLSEFGAGPGADCVAALEAMLRFIADNRDVWIGWTYWASGPWWPKDHPLSVQPHDGVDRPQTLLLQKYSNLR